MRCPGADQAASQSSTTAGRALPDALLPGRRRALHAARILYATIYVSCCLLILCTCVIPDWRSEQVINRLKQLRRVDMRYGKLAASYHAMGTLAAILMQ